MNAEREELTPDFTSKIRDVESIVAWSMPYWHRTPTKNERALLLSPGQIIECVTLLFQSRLQKNYSTAHLILDNLTAQGLRVEYGWDSMGTVKY